MESIVFRWNLNADADNAVEWVNLDRDGRPHISTKVGSLNDLARQLNNQTHKKHAIWLMPASLYSLHDVNLPPKLSLNNAKKAAPFALEEELTDAVDQYHFAFGDIEKTDNSTIVNLAAVNKIALKGLIERLNEHHIKPKMAYAEHLLLPASSSPSIYIEGEDIYARIDDKHTYALPANLLDTLFDDIDGDDINVISQDDIRDQLPSNRNIHFEQREGSLTGTMAKEIKARKPVNFLQGEFKTQEELGKFFKPWRWPALLGVLAMIFALTAQYVDLHKLEQENLALEDEKVEIFKRTFPRSKKFHSVKTRMEQALKKTGKTGKSSQFIPLMQQYSTTINASNNITVNGIDYNKDKLSLDLVTQDIQVLDKVKISLEEKKSIAASIVSSKSVADGIEATLRMEKR